MEIFGIGPGELVLVFILALIFIGPGKMPEIATSVGKAIREFQKASAELSEALNAEVAAAQAEKAAAELNGNGAAAADISDAEVVAQPAEEEAPRRIPPPVPEALAALPSYSLADVMARTDPEPVAESAEAPAATESTEAETPHDAQSSLAAPTEPAPLAAFGLEPLPAALLVPSDSPLAGLVPSSSPTPNGKVEPAAATAAETPTEAESAPVAADSLVLNLLGPLPAALLAPSAPEGRVALASPTGSASRAGSVNGQVSTPAATASTAQVEV